jgi:hypothetical protein
MKGCLELRSRAPQLLCENWPQVVMIAFCDNRLIQRIFPCIFVQMGIHIPIIPTQGWTQVMVSVIKSINQCNSIWAYLQSHNPHSMLSVSLNMQFIHVCHELCGESDVKFSSALNVVSLLMLHSSHLSLLLNITSHPQDACNIHRQIWDLQDGLKVLTQLNNAFCWSLAWNTWVPVKYPVARKSLECVVSRDNAYRLQSTSSCCFTPSPGMSFCACSINLFHFGQCLQKSAIHPS